MTTGRLLAQYHTRTRTGKSPAIEKIAGMARVEISPLSAALAGISDGDRVRMSSRRGSITAEAEITDRVGDGLVFLPFHFRDSAANLLTSADALDPESRIPEFKATAVKISKVEPEAGKEAPAIPS